MIEKDEVLKEKIDEHLAEENMDEAENTKNDEYKTRCDIKLLKIGTNYL